MSESKGTTPESTTSHAASEGHIAGAANAAKAEPSGPRGDNPSTAGPGNTGIRSATPENSGGHINPSAPGDTGTTPATTPRN
ncbi:hypothetical protein [Terriglobus roseus]|uniref:Uncharacterized protein n=1 Tax=Terriglobus roseus TaxID=392734 RepID=A0A1H4L802_9BACT|nr:hypothetical protein [Terriglobus roseus]SEB66578.1 hypothetical protein SAMN05443244_1495 [Terriglobus roseus]